MRHKLRVSDYPDGMRLDEISARIKEAFAAAQVESLAAEVGAYNLDKVRKLVKRISVLQHNITALDMRGAAYGVRIQELENTLSDARRDHALLVRLVERMGRDLAYGEWQGDYTIIGQRQRDAELHEAEGAPPGPEMLEDIQ